jgi:hypothetical protein
MFPAKTRREGGARAGGCLWCSRTLPLRYAERLIRINSFPGFGVNVLLPAGGESLQEREEKRMMREK